MNDRDRRRFHDEGFMVIRHVVSAELAGNAVREIAGFVGADLADPRTWYGNAPVLDGIVPLHHAQSLWDIRQCPELHQVFAEFFGTQRLMVDMNRCIFRPPIDRNHPKVSHGTIHWDTDPRVCGPGSLQAVVLLTDVGRNGGGFQCLPRVYRDLDVWLARHARGKDFDFFNPGLNHVRATQIEGRAGDVILWSTKLPHGSASNRSKRPRVAAFVTMQPPPDDAVTRARMEAWWRTKRAPEHWRGLPGQQDPEPGEPAVLTDLGRKLIGMEPW